MEEASLCQRQRPVTLRVASLCSAKASSDFVGLEPQIKNQRQANLSLGIPRQIHNRSRIRRGQFRFAGKQRPLRKSIAERFAALTREERTFGSQSQLSAEASHASHGQSGINADSLHFFSFRMRKIRPRIMDSILFICSLTSS